MDETQAPLMSMPVPQSCRATLRRGFHALAQGSLGLALGLALLAALGTALASPELAGASYLIAGHTDARGTASHNDDLSRRRAQAVRNYLIATFPINPDRLYVTGFGARLLRSPQTPAAAINRRVEIALIVAR